MRMRSVLSVGGPSALALGMSALFWSAVPDPMPVHWDAHGVANGWAPKAVGLLLMPVIGVLTSAITYWAMSKGKAGKYSDVATVGIGGFLMAMHALMIHASLSAGHGLDMAGMAVLMGSLSLVLGLVMPKLSPNRWAGVRTAWTLGDEVNWRLTHRFAAWTMGIGGALGIVAGIVLPGTPAFVVATTGLLVGALLPLPYSYAIHRLRNR